MSQFYSGAEHIFYNENDTSVTIKALEGQTLTIGGSISVTAAGSDTQVQYNDSGILGAKAAFNFNDATNILSVPITRGSSTVPVTTPSFSFAADPDSGLWCEAADKIHLVAGGVAKMGINESATVTEADITINKSTFVTSDSNGEALSIDHDFPKTGLGLYSDTATTHNAITFYNSNGLVGSITTANFGITVNTVSDYRLKENVRDIENGMEIVNELIPSYYNFKADPTCICSGFLAHELQTVIPSAVTGTKDELNEDGSIKIQQISPTAIIPFLVAAVQDLSATVNELNERLTALE